MSFSLCKNCQGGLDPIFSLGAIPLVNHLLKKEEIDFEKKYDLEVGVCPQCLLVQLLSIVPPEELFKEYPYFSSTSSSFLEHCRDTADMLVDRLKLDSRSFVLEVASNDGAFLQFIKDKSIPILGVDPVDKVVAVAQKRGIPTRLAYFNLAYAKTLRGEGIEADLLYGANVLAHVPEVVDFLKGVEIVLSPHGTAVFEFPYIEGLFEGKFDTIYHEHVFYYSLLSLQNIFRNTALELYDVEKIPVQGGSLRIFVGHRGKHKVAKRFLKMVSGERGLGWDKAGVYLSIGKRARIVKEKLLKFIARVKKEGKSVAAYSAAAKGAVLLNFCGIGKNYLDFLVDKSVTKQGLYTPGTHFLIHPPAKVSEEKPDYLLVLAWNIADEIMAMEELGGFRASRGKFVIPIPEVKVVG